METRVDEISDGIYRLSTFMSDAGPKGFTYNQFLIDGDEPFLFHTGHRATFAVVSEAISSVMPLDRLRWISFGHIESDECGAMNLLLEAAPNAQVVHGRVGCAVSLNDIADRPPVALEDGAVLDLGGHRLHHIYTPHVPHGWEACVFHDETTSTLLCGDLFAQMGASQPTTTGDILGAAAEAEDRFRATCLTPQTAPTVRRLAAFAPQTLALMHGPSYKGDGAAALLALADELDGRFEAACARAT